MKIIEINKCQLCPFLNIPKDDYRIENEYLCTKLNMRFILPINIPNWCPLGDKLSNE